MRVVVLSYWLWQNWFNSDEKVIGKSYFFAGENRQVIGIMRPEFRFPDERVAFWLPLVIRRAEVTPGGFGPRMVARLKPGTDRAALVAQLEPLARRVQQRLGGPAPYARIMERHRPVVKPLREQLVGRIATALWILLGTVGIVFLVACVNVANLFMVRAENRRVELSVRRALGAGRADLVRPQLTEALLLAAAGGAVGGLIAWAGVPLLVSAAPDAVAGARRRFAPSFERWFRSRRCIEFSRWKAWPRRPWPVCRSRRSWSALRPCSRCSLVRLACTPCFRTA